MPTPDHQTKARGDGTDGAGGLQLVLAAFGVPALIHKEGTRTPWATWAVALALVLVFVLGKLHPDTFGAEQLAFDEAHPTFLAAFTAVFAHFGWMHLFGNLGFLIAFGNGVEQKLPPVGLAAFFAVAGAASIWVDALAGADGRLVGGASGAIAALMGACVVLQPRARVLVVVLRLPIQVPVLVFALFELAFQVLMWRLGSAGVAWVAHIAGIVLGLGVALAIHLSREAVPDGWEPLPRAAKPSKDASERPKAASSRSPWR